MVKDTLYIRRAAPEDAELLAELSEITFADTFRGTCTTEDLEGFIKEFYNPGQIKRELSDPADYYFIAFINRTAVGYARLREDESEVAIVRRYRSIELKRIYVLKEYHSKKIGPTLMNFTLDFAAEKNYDIIWLGVWEHNERAKAFYKKFGFIDSGQTHPFPIGNTPQTDIWLYRFVKDL